MVLGLGFLTEAERGDGGILGDGDERGGERVEVMEVVEGDETTAEDGALLWERDVGGAVGEDALTIGGIEGDELEGARGGGGIGEEGYGETSASEGGGGYGVGGGSDEGERRGGIARGKSIAESYEATEGGELCGTVAQRGDVGERGGEDAVATGEEAIVCDIVVETGDAEEGDGGEGGVGEGVEDGVGCGAGLGAEGCERVGGKDSGGGVGEGEVGKDGVGSRGERETETVCRDCGLGLGVGGCEVVPLLGCAAEALGGVGMDDEGELEGGGRTPSC